MTATLSLPKRKARKATKSIRKPAPERKPDTSTLLPLTEYDLIIVGISGGKDSLAALLDTLAKCDAAGVPRERIEGWHHRVDGGPDDPRRFDWPVTDAYCAALCAALGITYRRQWREGGIAREMYRENERRAPARFELSDGTVGRAGGEAGPLGTRRKYPAISADLSTRWCSPAAKIDVCRSAICNDPRLAAAKVLLVTGERREESDARAAYARVIAEKGTSAARRVDHWRIVLDWTEVEVWAAIRAARIRPHPVYYLGFGRVSCATCIFNDARNWAVLRRILPGQFGWHRDTEAAFGHTVRIGLTVVGQADAGEPEVGDLDPEAVRLATGEEYPAALIRVPEAEPWLLPSGAYRGHGTGPS